jgi:hypothetical protein
VGSGSAAKAVTLHHSGESPAFGVADNVNYLSRLEHVNTQPLAYLELVYTVGLDFLQVAAQAAFSVVSGKGFVSPLDLAKSQLDRLVPVVGGGLDLGYDAGTGFDNCHADHNSIFPEHLAHAQFFA